MGDGGVLARVGGVRGSDRGDGSAVDGSLVLAGGLLDLMGGRRRRLDSYNRAVGGNVKYGR